MNAQFPSLPKNPSKNGFREMHIYELVRQAADVWNIPLDQVARFQEWWDSGRTDDITRQLLSINKQSEQENISEFTHRFSQFYKNPHAYTLHTASQIHPSIMNLLDIAQYYLINEEVTVPHFVIHIASKDLSDIGELGESVLVLIGGKEINAREQIQKKKTNPMPLLEYLKKVQMLVGNLQIVSGKSLPDLYISNSISFNLSIDFPVKCRNLILAQKVKVEGISFMPLQMQVMGL